MYILGISGSPTKDANTDKLVKAIIEATGMEFEFIKLSEVSIGPCNACMDCVRTNECTIDDDFKIVGKKMLKADALVVGSPVYYGAVTAYTKALMERQYAFRHLNLLMRGKIGVAVGVGAASESSVTEWLSGVMTFAGMEVIGTMTAKGTICCSVCGVGEGCAYATWNAYCEEFAGEDYGIKENYRDYLEVLPGNVPYERGAARIIKAHRNVEDEPEVMLLAQSLGRLVAERLRQKEHEEAL